MTKVRVFRFLPQTVIVFALLALAAVPADATPSCAQTPSGVGCQPPPPKPLPPGPKITQTSLYPNYYVVGVTYAPPGNGSKSSLQNAAGFGTQQKMTWTETHTGNDTFNVLGQAFGNSWSGTSVGGTSTTVQTTDATILDTSSTSEVENHDQDIFWIWINPKLVVTTGGLQTVYSLMPRDPDPSFCGGASGACIWPYTVAQLKGLVSWAWWQQFPHTQQDLQAILGLDPFVNGGPNPTLDPQRFEWRYTKEFTGPVQAGSKAIPTDFYFEVARKDGTITGTGSGTASSTLMSESVPTAKIITGSAAQSTSIQTQYLDVTEYDTNYTQRASGTLTAQMLCYWAKVDVYFDKMYGSFAYVTTEHTALNDPDPCQHLKSIQGSVVDEIGTPVANETVTATFTDGSTRTASTDTTGSYQLIAPVKAGGAITVVPTHTSLTVIPAE